MQQSAQTILVTGATGFVGRAVCEYLNSAGYKIRALVREQPEPNWTGGAESIDLVTGDIGDRDTLAAACAHVDAAIHLAGIAHVNNIDKQSAQANIVSGTENLLAAAVQQGVKRFVYFSSSLALAAEQNDAAATDYARSKWAAEKLVQAATLKGEIEGVILRPVNIYGVGMQGNIAGMISLIARGLLPRLPRVDSRISLIGVNDVARAAELVLQSTSVVGNTFLLTDGESYTISEIEEAVYRELGRKLPGWHIPRMVLYAAAAIAGVVNKLRGYLGLKTGGIGLRTYHNLVSENLFSSEAIRSELGFIPSTTLYKQLPDIVQSIK